MKIHDSKFFLLLLLAIFVISSCTTRSQGSFFSGPERKRYEDFFRRFLFLEQAVYTLYGSKPMTEIVLTPESPADKIAAQNRALQKLSQEERIRLEACSIDYEEGYWFEETWAMWEEKLKTLPIKRYLFVERKVGIPIDLQKNRYVYFINIDEMVKVLQQNYPLFKDYVGFDFDPLSVVFDAKNVDSPFWKAIWGREISDKSVCLMGILFGYGMENSHAFSKHHFKSNEKTESIKLATSTVSIESMKQFNPPQSFLLPGYTSFSEPDYQKEKYNREYAMIRQIYMHSNMLECTMQQLLKK